MATITASGTFPVGAGDVATATTRVTIQPAIGTGTGRGRLVHPALGVFDYLAGPDQWQNVDGDAIIAPIWSTQKTLLGAANTLFVGDLRDVIVEERWVQSIAMPLDMARMLIAIWQNPPDPADGYVQWWPSYANELGFNVVILSLSVAGNDGVTMSPLVKNGAGWVRGPVTLRMRIAGRVDE